MGVLYKLVHKGISIITSLQRAEQGPLGRNNCLTTVVT